LPRTHADADHAARVSVEQEDLVKLSPFTLIALGLIAGCATPSPTDPDAPSGAPAFDRDEAIAPETAVPDDAAFVETRVIVDGDHATVTTRAITAGEERAERAGGPAPLVAGDLVCRFGFRLYDRTDYTGNRICFGGTGSVDLRDYGWDRETGSAVAGVHEAALSSPPDGRVDAGGPIKSLFVPAGQHRAFSIAPDRYWALQIGNLI
jgi:hypothetical protein